MSKTSMACLTPCFQRWLLLPTLVLAGAAWMAGTPAYGQGYTGASDGSYTIYGGNNPNAQASIEYGSTPEAYQSYQPQAQPQYAQPYQGQAYQGQASGYGYGGGVAQPREYAPGTAPAPQSVPGPGGASGWSGYPQQAQPGQYVPQGSTMVGGYMMGDGTVFVTEPPPPPPAQFAVLVGSFRLDQNANVASEQVVSMGFNTYRKTQYINGVPFVRIYAGPFIDQNSANNAFNHLKAYLNFSGSIVPFEPS